MQEEATYTVHLFTRYGLGKLRARGGLLIHIDLLRHASCFLLQFKRLQVPLSKLFISAKNKIGKILNSVMIQP